MLIDAGYGTIRRMLDSNFDPQDIDLAFASHFHPDHFADFFNLVFARSGDNYGRGRPARELLLFGPKGLENNFKAWRKIFWREWDAFGGLYPVNFLEGERIVEMGEVRLETFSVRHVDWCPSVGLMVESGGKKIVYTGDLGCENDLDELAEIAAGANLLICEAGASVPGPIHLTLEGAKKLADKAKAEKTLLFHIFPENEKKSGAFCRHSKKIILGRDKMKINIP